MSRCIVAGIAALLMSLMTPCAHADVKLPAIIGDNMVLQVGRELSFWGWAEPSEEITVTILTVDPGNPSKAETASTTTGADGRWLVKLPAQPKVGRVGVTITGKNSVSLTNVLIGDVWICSGQSNMEWPVSSTLNHQEEIALATFPSIRFFKVERSTALMPQTQVDGAWIECTPETIGDFSAIGYFFGRELHRRLNRPIGLIQAAQGGANCEAWTSHSALKSDEEFSSILARAEKANNDPKQANNPNRASVLFNGMIAPLRSYSIKGVIWYQGESNASRARQYRKLFPAMITDWRRGWGQGDFPFLYVQLANYVSEKSKPDHPAEPDESAWAELREAQSKALELPKTGMAVTIDVGDPRDINPKNKQVVGYRLALAALKIAEGQDVVASGPTFKMLHIVGSEAHIEFQNIGEGLVAQGDQLTGFAIAGVDKKFVWADARIDGNRVIVTSPQVVEPIAVRYAWGDNPDCNLFNLAKLPAAPFRTDDWPGVTTPNK